VSRSRPVRWRRVLLLGSLACVLTAVGVVGAVYASTEIPEPSADSRASAVRILYADRSELGRTGTQNRIPVELAAVPEHVQHAVLAAEDRGFYTEPGISPRGIARALLTNVRSGGGVQQGGSTITQQYAKNAFLTSERTYTRKVKEVFIALKMSRTLEKDQILEDYLNTIYWGRQASGIAVAARAYFGTDDVSTLTVAQGAVLASSIRSPATLDPTEDPERPAPGGSTCSTAWCPRAG
jgi:membrane peptidoglycan carboxypeptidase